MHDDLKRWRTLVGNLIESRLRILYHGTDQRIDIAQCRPLTHFGNRKAAVNRIAFKADRLRMSGQATEEPNYLYGVEFVAQKPLWFYDAGFNHNLPAMAAAIRTALHKQSLRATLPYDAQGIADAVKSLGFDSLAYRNRAENGNSYVALGPENIKRVVSTEVITGQSALKLAAEWHAERYSL